MNPAQYKRLSLDLSTYQPVDLTRWKVGFGLAVKAVDDLTVSLGILTRAMAPMSAAARDIDWRRNWYKDPASAWWEQDR